MNTQLPKLKFSELERDFFLTSPFNPGVWNRDSGDTTEDNADLRGNQVKPWDAFIFLRSSTWLLWFFFFVKKVILPILIQLDHVSSSNIKSYPQLRMTL